MAKLKSWGKLVAVFFIGAFAGEEAQAFSKAWQFVQGILPI